MNVNTVNQTYDYRENSDTPVTDKARRSSRHGICSGAADGADPAALAVVRDQATASAADDPSPPASPLFSRWVDALGQRFRTSAELVLAETRLAISSFMLMIFLSVLAAGALLIAWPLLRRPQDRDDSEAKAVDHREAVRHRTHRRRHRKNDRILGLARLAVTSGRFWELATGRR